MIFFDYLYYSIYRFYSDFGEKGAASTSAGIVGGFQALNALTVIMLFELLFQSKLLSGKLLVVALVIIFQITTYYRYNYKESPSVDALEKKWLAKTEAFKKQMSTVLFLYGALTVISVFALAGYLGSRNQ